MFVTDLKLPVGNEKFGPEVSVTGTVDPPVFGKCGPVQVEVSVYLARLREGTEGFEWVVEPGRSEVRFALAVSDLSDPGQVRMSKSVEGRSLGIIDSVSPPPGPDDRVPPPPSIPAQRKASQMTLIVGRITDWPLPSSIDRNVTLRFDADWAERRSLGSCYVRLPALVGDPGLGSRPAAAALGGVPKVLGNMGAIHGSVRPESGTGVVAEDATASQPEPDPGFLWQCDVDRAQSEVVEVEGDRTFTRVVPRGGPLRDCAARVTVTNARVLSSQLFWAFVLAAVFSFGLGLVYDSIKNRGTTAR